MGRLHASPSVVDLLKRIAALVAFRAHSCSQGSRPAARTGLGIETVAVFRLTPAGYVPTMMMSVGSSTLTGLVFDVARRPLPVRHSPQATVLVEPSMMSRRPIAAPPALNGPLGGPPLVTAGPETPPP